MKKIISSRLYLLILFVTFSTITFSQTIINYQTWTGASGCNIFASSTNVPATINGVSGTVEHLTAIGQPTYDNVNKSVNLVSEIINGSQNQGTEYRTTVNFKLGYSYTITISAARIMSQQTGANVLLRLDLNSGGSGGNTLCNGTGVIDANGSGGLKQSLQITSTSFADYVFNYSSLSAAQTYLMVAAIPPAGSVLQTILIRKITIVETPPAASFNITPATVTLACGSTTPTTFTVNNGAGTTGITGYTWNLGTTPNGWLLPNGTAAPATYSTGLTNTLTLTPVCGSVQKNVSATVAANGNNYNTTNAATVSITQPTMSISGNASFCSGTSTYSITGFPCNATLAWNVSPTGIVTPSTSTSTTPTFTKVTNGNITLSATVTSCGVTQSPLTKPIHVGAYTTSDYTLSGNSGSNYWCPNQTLTFSVNGSGSSYSWSIPSGWTTIYNGGSYIQVKTPTSPNPPTGTLSVSFLEPCGSLLQLNRYLAYNSSVCTPTFPYTISPNPASSTITIACTSLQTYCNISSVQITDIYGTVKSSQSWNYTNQQVQMPVSFLTNGTYIARVYDGSQWYSGQFQVQH